MRYMRHTPTIFSCFDRTVSRTAILHFRPVSRSTSNMVMTMMLFVRIRSPANTTRITVLNGINGVFLLVA